MFVVDVGSVGLGIIFEDFEIVFCGDCDNFGYVSWEIIEVYWYDCGGFVGNRGFDGSWVEGKCDWVDVSEYWFGVG